MCFKIGVPAATTLVLGSTTFAYMTHRIGFEGALGVVAAGELLIAVAVVAWVILFMRREHSPGRIVEHMHTHPHHNKHNHGHAHDEPGPVWPTRAYQPQKERS